MKHISLIFTIISAFAICNAQENYNGSNRFRSVEINPDRTATLRLKAPAGHKVTAFATFAPGVWVDMQYIDSLKQYEYTTPEAVTPYHHTYFFVVDGIEMTDPANVHTVRDVTWQRNFILPAENETDQAALMSVNPGVPRGSLMSVWYGSATAGKQRRMNVYLPPAYFAEPERRFPVLYLLHGKGGDENAWPEMGRISQVADNLIAQNRAGEMIIVMPNGNIDTDAAPGYGEAGLVQPQADYPHLFTGEFDMAFPEIVAFADSTFRTVPDKAHRAIAGLSMGGYNAANISREYPEMFDYVGLFSAATAESLADGSVGCFDPGAPVATDIEGKLVQQNLNAPKLYWIAIGDADFLYDANTAYRRKLDKLGIKYVYKETPGGHSWANWREYIVDFMPLLFK